jgi:hypothetical protein
MSTIKSINEPETVGHGSLRPASPNEPPVAPDMPTPVITSLEPNSCVIGQPDFTLYVHGTGFFAGSVIHFAGHDEPTTLNEDGTLSTGVKPSLWLNPAVVQCAIRNGEVVSAPVDFTFREEDEPPTSRHAHKRKR